MFDACAAGDMRSNARISVSCRACVVDTGGGSLQHWEWGGGQGQIQGFAEGTTPRVHNVNKDRKRRVFCEASTWGNWRKHQSEPGLGAYPDHDPDLPKHGHGEAAPKDTKRVPGQGVFTLGNARSFLRLTSKIPPVFDADVKRTTPPHRRENRFIRSHTCPRDIGHSSIVFIHCPCCGSACRPCSCGPNLPRAEDPTDETRFSRRSHCDEPCSRARCALGASHWVHHTGCITLGASHWVCHTGCVTLSASHWVHHTGCITLGVSHWVHHTGCITLGVSHWVHHTGCITLGVSHWVCHTKCITLGASHWVHHTGCITLGASHWVQHTGCVTLGTSHWVQHTGCSTLGASHWVQHTGCSTLGAAHWVQHTGCSTAQCAQVTSPVASLHGVAQYTLDPLLGYAWDTLMHAVHATQRPLTRTRVHCNGQGLPDLRSLGNGHTIFLVKCV